MNTYHFLILAHYPQDFLDALFAFVTYLIQTQSGGQMLMSAGIIPTLLTILGNKKPTQLKVQFAVLNSLEKLCAF